MKKFLTLSLVLGCSNLAYAEKNTLQLQDVFNLEYANQIDITEDGKTVYFVRNRMDIKTDRKVGNIWSVDYKTKQMQPLPLACTWITRQYSLLMANALRLYQPAMAAAKYILNGLKQVLWQK